MDAAVPPPPSILFTPLRLGLMSEVAPASPNEPGCNERIETIGNATATTAGTAMQYFASVRLPMLPRLTLAGFSRAGCPADSSIGGGAVYVVPLRPSVFFVASAGVLAQPPFGPRPWTVHSQIRADVLVDRGGGRSWSVGVQAPRGGSGPRLTFGGVF